MRKLISIIIALSLWGSTALAIPPMPFPSRLGVDSAGRNLSIIATKGDELAPALTAANWDVVAGWDLSGSTLNHNAAGAGAITPVVSIAPTAGVTYRVVITLSAVTVENCTYTLGGVTGTLLASATTYTDYITATTNGDLTFTPFAATSRFTISAVSVQALTDGTGDLTVDGNLVVRSPMTFDSGNLGIWDINKTHKLLFTTTSDLTADRNLSFVPGDASRIITLSGDTTLSGTNTGDVTLAVNHGLGLTNQVINMGTPSSITGASTNSVTTTTHAHALDLTSPPAIGGTAPNTGVFTTTTVGSLATQDRIIIQGVAKGAGQFDGTLSLIDLTAARAWNLPNLDGTVGLLTNKLSDFAATTSTELLGVISDETGSGALVFGTSPTFTTQIISPIVYGSAADSGGLTLASTSSATKGNISIGRLTLSDLANSDGIVFGSLGTATRGIDLSGSGLSGATDYPIYIGGASYWAADGTITTESVVINILNAGANGNIYSNNFARTADNIDMKFYLDSKSSALFGNYTAVGSLTSVTRDTTATLTKAAHGLTLAVGELVHVTASTGSTDLGLYRIVSFTAGTIVADRALSGNDSSVALTVYKDVISMHATDATNGQMLTSWSAQNKPMQLGGTVLAATSGLTSKDIYFGGDIGSGGTVNTTTTNAYVVGGGQVATTKNTGWLQVYIGTVLSWIPYWSNATP